MLRDVQALPDTPRADLALAVDPAGEDGSDLADVASIKRDVKRRLGVEDVERAQGGVGDGGGADADEDLGRDRSDGLRVAGRGLAGSDSVRLQEVTQPMFTRRGVLLGGGTGVGPVSSMWIPSTPCPCSTLLRSP